MGRFRRGIFVGIAVVVLTVGGYVAYTSQQARRHQARSPFLIVEGKSYGPLSLGMSLGEVRTRLSTPILLAADEGGGVSRYNWDASNGLWSVFFDKIDRAVVIMFAPVPGADRDTRREHRRKVKFETVRGARYNHDAETIAVIYGKPSQALDHERFLSYYYQDLRTEFVFDCDGNYAPLQIGRAHV